MPDDFKPIEDPRQETPTAAAAPRGARGAEAPTPLEIGVAPGAAPAGNMTITEMMAMDEPRRTDMLEKAVQAGVVVNLRSRTDADVVQSYGEFILRLGRKSKPFTAAHALHLLWYRGSEIEEVPE